MVLVAPPTDPPVVVTARPAAPGRDRAARVGLVAWCGAVVVGLAWGTVAVRHRDVGLHAAPFKGHWAWHGGWQLLPAAGLGAAVAAWGPQVARRLRWRRVPVVAGAAAAAWTALLAVGDGVDRITAPLASRFEYEPFAAGLGRGDLGRFLGSYVERLDGYPVHVQGHPPGPVVLAWSLDRLGFGGAGWLAAIAVGAWGVAVAATLATARTVAGEAVARRAAPGLAVLPAAVWAGTSLDPVFAALIAVAVALAVRPAATAAAGLVLGTALLFSYGTVPLIAVVVVAALVAHRHAGLAARAARLGLVALGALAVLAAAAAWAGFWWPAGLAATRAAYWRGIGSHRPGFYTTIAGNPAALAVAVGPAVAVGLARLVAPARATLAAVAGSPCGAGGRWPNLAGRAGPAARSGRSRGRDRAGDAVEPAPRWDTAGLVVLVGAAAVAMGVADVSQLARGEVERIWLPFVPWLALAAQGAPGDRRGWLAAQVVVALAVQSLLVSPW